MDKSYLTSTLAETLGNELGILEAEHRLLNTTQLEFGMKRQLQDIHDQDEKHVKNLTMALDTFGKTSETDSQIERGKKMCEQIVEQYGDDPINMIKATVLAKYKSADAAELIYNLCSDAGQPDICDTFEDIVDDVEDQIEYLREQAVLMAKERLAASI